MAGGDRTRSVPRDIDVRSLMVLSLHLEDWDHLGLRSAISTRTFALSDVGILWRDTVQEGEQ